MVGVEAAEEREIGIREAEDVEVFDVLVADVEGLVVGVDAALNAAVPPPSGESVHK